VRGTLHPFIPHRIEFPGDRRASDHAQLNGERRGPPPHEEPPGEEPVLELLNSEIPIFFAWLPQAGHGCSSFTSDIRWYDSNCCPHFPHWYS
jgi:hypothetical protein